MGSFLVAFLGRIEMWSNLDIMFMKRIIPVGMTVACLLAACGSKSNMPEPSFGQVPIAISAGVNNILGRSDVSSFPNAVGDAAQVSIIACKSTGADWSDLYINHAIANVGPAASGYSLSWAEGHSQFWPSNGEALTFMAYSPITVGGSGIALSVALSDATPDVLVASTTDGTTPITGMKSGAGQTPSSINFLFEHILSQLQVKIKNTDGGANITKVEIVVDKAQCSKKFDMSNGLWSPAAAASDNQVYSYSKMTGYGKNGAETVNETPVLLFPGTQSQVTINVYNGSNLFASRKVGDFLDTGNTAASLVAGKRTTLILSVAGNELSGMTAGVQDWGDLGNFETTVR